MSGAKTTRAQFAGTLVALWVQHLGAIIFESVAQKFSDTLTERRISLLRAIPIELHSKGRCNETLSRAYLCHTVRSKCDRQNSYNKVISHFESTLVTPEQTVIAFRDHHFTPGTE